MLEKLETRRLLAVTVSVVGSTFTVTLPRAPAHAPRPRNIHQVQSSLSAESHVLVSDGPPVLVRQEIAKAGVVPHLPHADASAVVVEDVANRQIGDVVFRMTPRYGDTPWVVSLLAILVVIGASVWVLERRVRGVEVVS